MRLRSFLSGCAFVLMSATSVYAADSGVSITAEPYVGYGFIGSTNVSYTNTILGAGSSDGGNYTGFGFGARGLVNFAKLFFAGVDLSYYPSFSYGVSGAGSISLADSGAKSFKAGIVGGVALPTIPLRFWLGLNVLDTISDTTGSGLRTSDTGLSFKVGAGYRPIPLLSINLEFIRARYGSPDQTTLAGVTTTSNSVTLTHNLLFLSASVPFTFPLN